MASDAPLINGLVTDLPMPGTLKLRIRSDGTPGGTTVVAVDHEGTESRVISVQRVEWACGLGDGVAIAKIDVAAPEVDIIGSIAPEEDS